MHWKWYNTIIFVESMSMWLYSTMSCPSGGRLSTSPRSIWAFCTACILVLIVPIRACCAELYAYRKTNRFTECSLEGCRNQPLRGKQRMMIHLSTSGANQNKLLYKWHTPLTWLHKSMNTTQISYWEPFCCSYKRRHVSAVHLTHRDLLLGRWHGAHAERLCANGAGTDHPRQRHRAMLHPAHTIKLLLKDGGPAGTKTGS